ncbi:GGDEF domain-containing protein [Oceanisphaera sp. KMM 10153]|uniref:GGDEF domain-containing protein n=1 Tax=Oceanisphaera submarina TaxID=3390193 RepID=UPI00397632C2
MHIGTIVIRVSVLLLVSLAALSSHAEVDAGLHLNKAVHRLADHQRWYPLDASLTRAPFPELQQRLSTATAAVDSLIGRSGTFVTRIPINNTRRQTWFVVPGTNFIDTGLAYWQPDEGSPRMLAEFSQLKAGTTPRLMHNQALPLSLEEHESGQLWVLVQAQHFPTRVPLTFYSRQAFYQHQFRSNTATVGAIAIMLTLAVLALAIYVRTRQPLSLTYAGYVGLHALGWAAAAGAINGFAANTGLNLTYAGMHLFPFAIACASLFACGLFNCTGQHPGLARVLKWLAIIVTLLGMVMLWLPFQVTFYLSHLVALVWVPLSLWIGVTMLSREDFRAKYYLVGNLFYSASLVYYVISHSSLVSGLAYPELAVVTALAVDCVCILFSLAEWLKIKQNDFNRAFYEARIDPLTQVGNRLLMQERLSCLSGTYIIMFIDFDGMKAINDSMGHDAGDHFLSEASRLMRKQVSQSDEIFRTGGDEFVWLVQGITTRQLPGSRRRLESTISNIETALHANWPMSGISFGLVTSQDGGDASECLAMADRKMYRHKATKQGHRNRDVNITPPAPHEYGAQPLGE